MPSSALFAVLRDITKLAATAADDLASQTVKLTTAVDDVVSLTGKATAQTAGVAGDDLAVGAGQVGGISPSREVPAILRIMKGSAVNKAWLSVVLLIVAAFLPWAITVALCFGALYLAYEGGEALLEKFHPPSEADDSTHMTEDQKVRGAIRTDLVLSLEILVIALSSTGDESLVVKGVVLALVSVVMTLLVYGTIMLIVRLDDMGLALARKGGDLHRRLGKAMVNAAPVILRVLEPLGMVAMFAVAGGIFSHLVHLTYPHWAIALLADSLVGVLAGVALAGSHMVLHRVLRKSCQSA